MATRTAMKLFELSFSEILLPLLAVTSAVAAGFVIWDTFGADMESAADKAKKLAEALEKIPRLLEEIADTQKRGIISGTHRPNISLIFRAPRRFMLHPAAREQLTRKQENSRMLI